MFALLPSNCMTSHGWLYILICGIIYISIYFLYGSLNLELSPPNFSLFFCLAMHIIWPVGSLTSVKSFFIFACITCFISNHYIKYLYFFLSNSCEVPSHLIILFVGWLILYMNKAWKKFLRERLRCFLWVDKTRSWKLDGPGNSAKKILWCLILVFIQLTERINILWT